MMRMTRGLQTASVHVLLILSQLYIQSFTAVVSAKTGGIADYPNCTDNPPKQNLYNVVVTQLDAVGRNGTSLISHVNGTSDFAFNFNAAWFPSSPHNKQEGLVVRLVDYEQHPEWADAGALAIVPVHFGQTPPLFAQNVQASQITWAGSPSNGPIPNVEEWGAADPRIVYRPGNRLYYLTWDNCTKHCWPKRVTYLSTTTNPFDPNEWQFHGPVFPFPYTSGAALLFRDDDIDADNNESDHKPPHLAFVCNSNTADTVFIAESMDGLQWSIPKEPEARKILMKGRPNCWDAKGVAVGPQPIQLANGDYLLIYNIDTGWPYIPIHLVVVPLAGRYSTRWILPR